MAPGGPRDRLVAFPAPETGVSEPKILRKQTGHFLEDFVPGQLYRHKLGKKVQIVKREDPALLGGVVAKVGDVVYDGSLRTQLRTLRDELTK